MSNYFENFIFINSVGVRIIKLELVNKDHKFSSQYFYKIGRLLFSLI